MARGADIGDTGPMGGELQQVLGQVNADRLATNGTGEVRRERPGPAAQVEHDAFVPAQGIAKVEEEDWPLGLGNFEVVRFRVPQVEDSTAAEASLESQ